MFTVPLIVIQGVLTQELHTHLWKLKNCLLWSVPRETELDNIKKYITGMLFALINIDLHIYLKTCFWNFLVLVESPLLNLKKL